MYNKNRLYLFECIQKGLDCMNEKNVREEKQVTPLGVIITELTPNQIDVIRKALDNYHAVRESMLHDPDVISDPLLFDCTRNDFKLSRSLLYMLTNVKYVFFEEFAPSEIYSDDLSF